MSHNRLPPPREEVCLVRLRQSTQKGGTIIAEHVTDRATHDRHICDPDAYRPAFCPRCRGTHFHVHDYRERHLRAEPDATTARTVRHACVDCEAIWQILPAFIARHLWRTWRVIAHTLMSDAPGAAAPLLRWPKIPTRTARRWRARWQRPAQYLAQILAASGDAAWAALAGLLRPDGACADLVAAYARVKGPCGDESVAAVAALLYRLQPRIRLM